MHYIFGSHSLSHNDLLSSGGGIIGGALRVNPEIALKELHLDKCYLANEGAIAIVNGLTESRFIEWLSLRNNGISLGAMEALGQFIQKSSSIAVLEYTTVFKVYMSLIPFSLAINSICVDAAVLLAHSISDGCTLQYLKYLKLTLNFVLIFSKFRTQ
jgi:Ran GTPase-activating protein (RanGAP) involved in mRNA processing and transport